MGAPPDLRVVPRRGIESRLIDDGAAVLVDMDTGKVFELNRIGAEVWALLISGAALANICEVLGKKYQVEATVLEADVTELVGSLLDAGLVERTADASTSTQ